jgi:hypothetical protein
MSRFLHGGKAEQAYSDTTAEAVVVIWKAGKAQRGEFHEKSGKPSAGALKALAEDGQALVFDTNLEWTALFHHDDLMPTCFARCEWIGDG